MLSQLLATIAGQRVFIVCRLEPKPNGKTNKIPVNPHTGLPSDAQDPSTWLTLAQAEEAARAGGYGVGIVIHEQLGIGCIDVDSAYSNGQWSQLACDLCARFPGAYVEVSQSGTGLHIFFRHKGIPEHRTRKFGLPIEVYTRARFILLTGTAGVGDINIDHTAALQKVIADYLPEPAVEHATEWTTQPIASWRGGGTDAQIIQGLRDKQSMRAALGGGASFADLFDANIDALVRFYPPDGPGKDYNASAADQALANCLAAATGYNCDHMLRLMWLSPLQRSKWEREDYLRRTILTAVAGKTEPQEEREPAPALTAAPVAPTPPAPAAETPVADVPASEPEDGTQTHAGYRPSGSFALIGDQQQMFDGCIYIEDIHGILMPDGAILAQKQFDVRFGGYEFQMKSDGTKQTDSAWEAFVNSKMHRFSRAHALTFDPTREPRDVIYKDNKVFINSWVPVPIMMQEGDITKFFVHIYTLFPNGRDAEILIAYFAFLMQYPGVKAQWWPFLQGVEGNGKTFFSYMLEYCVGESYTHHAKASQIDNRFNSAFYGKLLICIEDAKVTEASAATWESLKPMITNKRMEIEGKGLDKVTRDVCFNGIVNSNHKDGIRKTQNDRRIAPFFAAQQHASDLIRCGLTEKYFAELYKWARDGGFAAIAYFLKHYEIPDELNPAKDCVRAPVTSSTQQAISQGQGSIEQEILEAAAEGREGFRKGWINSGAFDRLLRELGKSRYLPRSKRPELLEAIGYMKHPKLPDGRCIRPLTDGTKPTLYITKVGHHAEHTEAHMFDVPAIYEKDQKPE